MTSKEAYIKDLEQELDRWDAQIARLYKHADRANEEDKHDYLVRIGAIRDHMNLVRDRLESVRDVDDDGWALVVQGFEQIRDSLSDTIESLVKKLK